MAGANPDAPIGLDVPRRYHLWVLNVWQLLSPTALGSPHDYFGDDNYWETLLSIGLAPWSWPSSEHSSIPTAAWFEGGSC